MRRKRNTSLRKLAGTGSTRQVVDSRGCIDGQIVVGNTRMSGTSSLKVIIFSLKKFMEFLLLRCGGWNARWSYNSGWAWLLNKTWGGLIFSLGVMSNDWPWVCGALPRILHYLARPDRIQLFFCWTSFHLYGCDLRLNWCVSCVYFVAQLLLVLLFPHRGVIQLCCARVYDAISTMINVAAASGSAQWAWVLHQEPVESLWWWAIN